MAFNSDTLKAEQLKYLQKSYKVGGDKAETEVVDILNDYAWLADRVVSAGSDSNIHNESSDATVKLKASVPFCYVVERRSAANAGIANIFNLISHISQTFGKGFDSIGLGSLLKKEAEEERKTAAERAGASNTNNENTTNTQSSQPATNQSSTPPAEGATDNSAQTQTQAQAQKDESTPENNNNDSGGTSLSSFAGELKKMFEGVTEGMQSLIKNNNLNSSVLLPYQYLYITKATGKKYVFPLANNFASFSPLKNQWGNGTKLPGFLQQGIDLAYKLADGLSAGANLVNNAKNFLNGKGDDVGNIREMAKSYVYPQNGDGITVNFTLYNTTKVNAWQENYRFLFLFVLRNLPLRIDVASFVPPVLYDVIVPGVKHLPVCSVEGINVVPKGMIRTLKCKNFVGDGDLTVNVPEAWEVTISFRCLIGHAANMVMSGMYAPITTSEVSTPTPENTQQ